MNNTRDLNNPQGTGLATALGAAVIGAAVGAAAAYLSDADNRKKVSEKATELKNSTSKMATDLADKTGTALEGAGKKVKASKDKIGEAVDNIDSSNDSFGAF